jgi:mono/diheme cytochrome c family protein
MRAGRTHHRQAAAVEDPMPSPDIVSHVQSAPKPRAFILAFAVALAGMTGAQAQEETTVKAGLEIWKTSGCSDCHGPFANGDKDRDEAPTGANLRTSRLDDAALKETIRCGRPGAGMPSFDEGAYRVRVCNGEPLDAPPDDLYPAPRTLSLTEIDTLIVYLKARVIGHGRISRADCLYYFYDAPESMCDDYK